MIISFSSPLSDSSLPSLISASTSALTSFDIACNRRWSSSISCGKSAEKLVSSGLRLHQDKTYAFLHTACPVEAYHRGSSLDRSISFARGELVARFCQKLSEQLEEHRLDNRFKKLFAGINKGTHCPPHLALACASVHVNHVQGALVPDEH